MTNADRDRIDSEAQHFIKLCSDHLATLHNVGEIHPQTDAH